METVEPFRSTHSLFACILEHPSGRTQRSQRKKESTEKNTGLPQKLWVNWALSPCRHSSQHFVATVLGQYNSTQFIRLRPARRLQPGISLWSLFLSVPSVSLACSFVGLRADARLALFPLMIHAFRVYFVLVLSEAGLVLERIDSGTRTSTRTTEFGNLNTSPVTDHLTPITGNCRFHAEQPGAA